jgi:hypothetical protein
MPKQPKKKSTKQAKSSSSYFGIMLDYELDAVQDYWPVRNPTTDIEVLKRQVWIKGNVSMLPADEWEATLKQCKSLSPQGTGKTFSGGIYLFTYVGGP